MSEEWKYEHNVIILTTCFHLLNFLLQNTVKKYDVKGK